MTRVFPLLLLLVLLVGGPSFAEGDVDGSVTSSGSRPGSVTGLHVDPAAGYPGSRSADAVTEGETHDGFGDEVTWAVLGLAALGLLVWAFSRSPRPRHGAG